MRKFRVTYCDNEFIYHLVDGEFMEVISIGEPSLWRDLSLNEERSDDYFILSTEIRKLKVINHTRDTLVGCFAEVNDFFHFGQYYMRATLHEILPEDSDWDCSLDCFTCNKHAKK